MLSLFCRDNDHFECNGQANDLDRCECQCHAEPDADERFDFEREMELY